MIMPCQVDRKDMIEIMSYQGGMKGGDGDLPGQNEGYDGDDDLPGKYEGWC